MNNAMVATLVGLSMYAVAACEKAVDESARNGAQAPQVELSGGGRERRRPHHEPRGARSAGPELRENGFGPEPVSEPAGVRDRDGSLSPPRLASSRDA